MNTIREDRVKQAIEGLLKIADSNFPTEAKIRLSVESSAHSASIYISASELRAMLRTAAAPDMLSLLKEGLCAARADDWRQRVAVAIARATGGHEPERDN